jgi:hypothetical protein
MSTPTSTFGCIMPTTRHMTARALPQLHLAAQLPATRLHRLYCAYAVHPDVPSLPFDFSSAGDTGSRRAPGHSVSRHRLLAARLHRLYYAYVVHPGAPSHRSTSRRTVALAVTVLPVNLSCATTTHLPVARVYINYAVHRLLISRLHGLYLNLVMRRRASRSHWLSPCPVTASRGATTRRPDCTSSTAPMSCIQTRHLAARLLVRRSVALALAVRPVTVSRGATTRRPNCTSSTTPMSCIRTCRLDARLLISRSHWLSLYA